MKRLAHTHIGQPAFWLFPLILLCIAGGFEVLGDPARLALRYERSEILAGEAWRLVTGHLVHIGWQHLLLNALGLVLVWILVGSYLSLSAWSGALCVIVLCMDLAFWLLKPGLQWYVGLSGALHGLLIAGVVRGWRQAPAESAVLAAIVAAKLSWEQFGGALPGSELAAGGPVVVDAHLYGAVGGLIAGAVQAIMTRRRGSI